ncbi:hypothetical protein ACS0TY_036198 [Phlomoides rotata]
MSHTYCTKQKVKRGLWSPEERSTHGHDCWTNVPHLAGLQRCGKGCRLRWINYLKPDVKRGNITPLEAALIIELHELIGNRWAQIAKHLPGRTDNEVKNFWNSNLRKKLLANQSLSQLYATAASSSLNHQMDQPNPNPQARNPAPEYQRFDPDKAVDYEAVMSLMPKPANPPPSGSWSVNFSSPDESLMSGFEFDYTMPILPMYDEGSPMFGTLLPETSKMAEFGVFSPPPSLPVLDPILPANHIKNIESLMTSFAQPPPSGFSSTGLPSTSWPGYY